VNYWNVDFFFFLIFESFLLLIFLKLVEDEYHATRTTGHKKNI